MSANRIAFSTLLIALSVLFFSPFQAKAQNEFKGSPEKILQLANELYAMQRFSKAKEAYVEVLKKDPENYHATVRVAKCSYFIQEYEDAARYFESALEIDPKANDTVLLQLGLTYRVLDRHSDAREQLTAFRKVWKEDDQFARRVKVELKGCDFVEEQRKEEPKWRVQCLDVNTAMGDNFPAVLQQNEDEKYMVFTSSRTESKNNEIFEGYNEGYSDLWMSKIEDDTTFGVPENMGKKINKKGNDGNPTFSSDGMTMYYSICNEGKMGYGCSIFESKFDPRKKAWGKPRLVEELQGRKQVVVNSKGKTKDVPTYDVHPMLSEDGNTIYFVSDREGGEGMLDIWYATWQGDKWSEPMNMGARINTPFDELSPYPSRDGNTFYFASNGRVGFGGYDLYMSEGGQGSWGEPENMGAPINSTYDDLAGYWMEDDSSAYFTTNRPGCQGRDDIYWAKKIEQPPRVYAVHGLVIDRGTNQPVPFATVILYELDFEGDLIPLDTFKTDQTAEYNFELEPNKKYKVLGNAPEYLANEVNFDTENLDETDLEVNINIKLERIDFIDPIALNNIYYDFDKYDLRPESRKELDDLKGLMLANPNLIIEIGSHTDSNGSEPYNKTLSENRAKSVLVYLIENGIHPDRLKWYGYGESMLIFFPERNDEEEQMNRRSEFKVLSIDYSPN